MLIETCPVGFISLVLAPTCAANGAVVMQWAGLAGGTMHQTGMDGFFHPCQVPHVGTNGNTIIILELVNC